MESTGNGYFQKVLGVFSSVAFFVYSWSLLVFFWDIPSFVLRLSAAEIIGYAAYQLMFSLIETLAVTLFIAALGLILPSRFLRDNLQVSGTALVFAFAINTWVFKERLGLIGWTAGSLAMEINAAVQLVMGLWLISLFILPVSLVMAARSSRVSRPIAAFVKNLSVLASLYVTLSVFGILVVIVRNLN
jgi:hypothetical protein